MFLTSNVTVSVKIYVMSRRAGRHRYSEEHPHHRRVLQLQIGRLLLLFPEEEDGLVAARHFVQEVVDFGIKSWTKTKWLVIILCYNVPISTSAFS